jgi:ABC-2 type transport system ATP-binding protein
MIEIRGLRKSFGSGNSTVHAVRDLDLRVEPGEIFGFLGPNGAGKTTCLRMLTTLLRPDGGRALVAGADLRRDPVGVRRRIGFVAQGQWTWSNATAREELVMQARLYGVSRSSAADRAQQLIDAFDMTGYADRLCRSYSGGQRRRVDIALGVVHQPPVLFLDEPTTGLDPQSRSLLWDEVRRLRVEGTTVFLTTHYLDEADALCDRIAIIDHGSIVALGTSAQLKREITGDVVTLGVAGPVESAQAALDGQPCVRGIEVHDGRLRLYVDDGSTAIPQLLEVLHERTLRATTIELRQPSLDDVFLAKTGRSMRETG